MGLCLCPGQLWSTAFYITSVSSLVQTAYSIYASTLSICFRLTGPDCQSYHVCSKRGLKWNYWRHMSSINSTFSYQIVAFWFKPQVKSLWNFFPSIFPSVFNALGCLQFGMCLVGRASNEDLPGSNQRQRQAFTSPVGQTRLVARNVASVAAETLCQTRPVHQNKTQYKLFDLLFNSPMTCMTLCRVLTHMCNTWIVVYPLLGVNTHTRFHWETFVIENKEVNKQ